MDAHFYQLDSEGVGSEVKHAKTLSKDKLAWSSRMMGTTTPKALQNAAFFTLLNLRA